MYTYLLIIFLAGGDLSVVRASIYGFNTLQECEEARLLVLDAAAGGAVAFSNVQAAACVLQEPTGDEL